MPRAKSFQHIPGFAINVLARLAAKKAVTEELRAKGVRVTLVPHREIVAQAKAHLEAHPELYEPGARASVANGRVPPCQRIR